jgi:hypothetical protein
MTVDDLYFRQWGKSRTDLGSIRAILSISVGFDCARYIGDFEDGRKFQVKPVSQVPSVDGFWQWCLMNREQWYDLIPQAAVQFLKSRQVWQKEQTV